MRVTATAKGHYGGRYREIGDSFDVPDGLKGSWFKSTEQIEADTKAAAAKALKATAEQAKADAVNATRAAEQAEAALKATEAKLAPAATPTKNAGDALV